MSAILAIYAFSISALVAGQQLSLPSEMRFCGPGRCGTLTWSNGHYNAAYDDNSEPSTYTVEIFTTELIRIRRVDHDGAKSILIGRLSPEGNSVMDGRITFDGYRTFSFRMAWGDAIDTLRPRANSRAQAQGVTLTPLDPATVDDSERSLNSQTLALLDFLNLSGGPVDIYWIDFQGNRKQYRQNLPNGGRFSTSTYLTHPWLVVASGTGGTLEQDTGTRLAAFEAQTANPHLDPAIRDTAIIHAPAASSAPAPMAAAADEPEPGNRDSVIHHDGVYEPADVESVPTAMTIVEPDYSEAAEKLRTSNPSVALRFVVQSDGTVRDFEIQKSFGYGLEDKAIDAVRHWQFAPALKNRQAVACESLTVTHFNTFMQREKTTWYSGPMTFALKSGIAPPVVEDGRMPDPGADLSDESVVLEFTVRSTGAVKNVHPITGSTMSAALLEPYLGGWKFRPARDGGTLVEAVGRVRFLKGDGDESAKLPLFPEQSEDSVGTYSPQPNSTPQNSGNTDTGDPDTLGSPVYTVGTQVSNPVLIRKVEPEYSEEARRAKYAGSVLMSVVIDENGKPIQFRVVQRAGLGLDEKAIEAVRQWRFRPAMKDGQPVKVRVLVNVAFRLQ